MKTVPMYLLTVVCLALACSRPARNELKPELAVWPVPVEVRIQTGAFLRGPADSVIRLTGLAGEALSAQVAVRGSQDIRALRGELSALSGPAGAAIADCRVRYGGYLPVDETQSLTADPLLETDSVDVPANTAQPVWITVMLPRDAKAGVYRSELRLSARSHAPASLPLVVEVLPAALPEPPDWSFYLNIWQDPSAVARAHKVKVWSEEHWKILERYAANYAAHGMKAVMTHIIHDPWDSVRGLADDTFVEWQYPGEFQPGAAEKFTWDFMVFDRYVQMMLNAGVREKIDMYALVMGPGSSTKADIRYLDTSTGQHRNLALNVGDPLWKEVWIAFLPVLREHLKEKGWFGRAMLGFDEKPAGVMKTIFDFVVQYAPDFKVSSSGGYPGDERKWGDEIIFFYDVMMDPAQWEKYKPLVRRMREDPGKYVGFYTCCAPVYPNTFLFSQLRESRLMPWLARKYGLDGYIRWAADIYPENVWEQVRFTWPSGDMFFVYPGPDGPLDSMRWELLRQGIQDYEAYRIAWDAAEKAGRAELLDKLRRALELGTEIDNCGMLPPIAEARALVDEVLRELAPAER